MHEEVTIDITLDENGIIRHIERSTDWANSCCASCKYWERYQDLGDAENTPLGICNKVPHFYSVLQWVTGENVNKISNEYSDCKAFAKDGEGVSAHLLTMGKFCCVQFTKK